MDEFNRFISFVKLKETFHNEPPRPIQDWVELYNEEVVRKRVREEFELQKSISHCESVGFVVKKPSKLQQFITKYYYADRL